MSVYDLRYGDVLLFSFVYSDGNPVKGTNESLLYVEKTQIIKLNDLRF